MESRGEYVKFSKEKYLLDSPPEKLRRELEEELKLSSSDLRSHGWYHGRIPREVSETLVLRNGDFLIRDSLTSVGDYVLTSRWNHEVLHFKISKVLVKSSDSYSRVQYLLERESFDSVPALVHYYVGNRRPVSQQSGAHIYCPINRTLPLRYLEASFALANGKHNLSQSPTNQRGAHIKRRSVTMTDGLTTEKIIPHSPSTLHHKEAIRNCALSMDQIQEFSCPMSPVSETPLSPAYSSINRHKSPAVARVPAVVPTSPVMRRCSEPQGKMRPAVIPPTANRRRAKRSSPLEIPLYLLAFFPLGGMVPFLHCRNNVPIQEPLLFYSFCKYCCVSPIHYPAPCSRYQPCSLNHEHKTLQCHATENLIHTHCTANRRLRDQFNCPSLVRLQVARILDVTKETQRMMGVSSGLELLTLPHGHQLRLDLLERFHTMSIMMAVDLLGCTGNTEERAALLHKTIQLAAELKSNLGNMFGFAAVMRALELPQVT
uniref:SH2 domain containing 3Cb n=1 Tax=Lepisosteus oculatus TaxID=7918 RepID=W5M4I0_LEPOC